MNESFSIYEYTEPKDYLSKVFSQKRLANPRFSLRSWSKQIGLSSPAILSLVLKGKRTLKPKQAVKVRRSLELEAQEARYFDFLILYCNAGSIEEKEFYENILRTLKPNNNFSSIDLEKFRVISDWYHIAILELVKLKDFISNPQWIAKRLGDGVTASQIKGAIERLLKLGFLIEDKNRNLKRPSKRLATPTDFPDEGLKRFHTQMIEKALEALREQEVHERDITSNTVTTSTAKLSEAKKMIRNFRQNLAKFLDTPDGDETYQLNVQLFKLTRRIK